MYTIKEYSKKEQLELYKAMSEAQPQSMFLMDKEKNLIGIFNASPESLAGFAVNDLVGNSILTYANDPNSPFHQACIMLNSTFDPVFNTGTPLKCQYLILDHYFEATVTKISGERILSQVRDITDIVLQLKELEEKKRDELSIALVAGGLTSWNYDIKNNTISSTHFNNVIDGSLTLDELLALISPKHCHLVTKMFDDIITHKTTHAHTTVQVTNLGGKIQWSEVHAVPQEFSSTGEVIRIIGSQKDATREYEHQEKLKKLNRQNALILNNTHSGFAYLTSDLELEWENISGVFSDPDIIKLFQDKISFDFTQEYKEEGCISGIEKAIQTKERVNAKFKTQSGTIFEYIVQPVFDDTNEFEGIVVRIDDITEKEKFILELAEAKEKAEQSDHLKTAFLANMSHEIRTPLNSIVGFSQLLPEVSQEEQLEFINIINSNSQTLLNLINDILDLSKIEAGYFTCNDEKFNLCELFTQLEFTFKDKTREKVELICEIPQGEVFVNLDRIRVTQIVSNFITNAIKFTHKGHIKLGFSTTADMVKLYVEDTGCGMSSEQVKIVFDRFEKLNSFEQGTGLGTSIAKAIVDAYDGKIGLESSVNIGSTFWAVLPTNMH